MPDRPRRWLLPAGLAVIGLVIAATVGGPVGLGTRGAPLLVTLSLAAYAVAGVVFLLWTHAPRRVTVALILSMCAAATALHLGDPDGPVVGLYLAMAFAPLRLPRRTAVATCAVGVLVFATGLLVEAPNPVIFTLVVAGGAAFFFFFGSLVRTEQDLRERADRLVAALERSRQAEREAATAAERTRLAREMHDVLAHSLSGLVVHLDGARMLARTRAEDELTQVITRAHALAQDGLDEARQAISALRGQSLSAPESLALLVDRHRGPAGGECRWEQHGEPVRLPADAELAIYRAAQEALSNVRKHSPGSAVCVRLDWLSDAVVLTVRDDGRGHGGRGTAAPDATREGFGLRGMRERALLLGGSVEAGPTSDGFVVRLRLPVTGPREAGETP